MKAKKPVKKPSAKAKKKPTRPVEKQAQAPAKTPAVVIGGYPMDEDGWCYTPGGTPFSPEDL